MARKTAVVVLRDYDEELKADLLREISDYGNAIDFHANTWICNKLKKGPGYNIKSCTWYFNSVPKRYQEIVKYYTIHEKRIQPTTMVSRLSFLGVFLKYLEQYCAGVELNKVDQKIMNDFLIFLKEHPDSKAWKIQVWSSMKRFFEALKGWPELPEVRPYNPTVNPWKQTLGDHRHDDKYIPEDVAIQLDKLFYRNELFPVVHILIYWLLRLIPSRGCEIGSTSFNCLKSLGDGRLVLTIPTWKQNGGYIQPELRMIYLKGEGIIEYLVQLIKQQQEVTTRYQEDVPEKDKILFKVGQMFLKSKEKGQEKYSMGKRHVVVDASYITRFLGTYCMRYGIMDEDGKPYKVTSHQFRHNGISDRIDEGFSILEIRDMTGHKGDQMPRWAYYHPSKEKQIAAQKKVLELTQPQSEAEKPLPIQFRGRIMNLDEETERRLLKNPRAYKLRLGICSDITTCKSGIFECLACNYFIPKVEDIGYWEEMADYWAEKVGQARRKELVDENAEYNLALHRSIVRRIYITLEGLEVEECVGQEA